MEINHDFSTSDDEMEIIISPLSLRELRSKKTTEVDNVTIKVGSYDSVDVGFCVSGLLEISLCRQEVLSLLDGIQLIDSNDGVEISIDAFDESPLDCLERTWNEPRYGESASDHSARLARGVN